MAITELGSHWLGFESCNEVQRTNNFELVVTGLADILDDPNAVRQFRLAVERANLPSEDTTVQHVWYANSEAKIAGTTEYGTNQVTCRDIISRSGNIDIEHLISEWRKKVYNPYTDQVGFACDYRTDGRIVQYAPDGTLERTWYLENLWPSSVDYGDLQYGSGGALKTISITFQYDKAKKVYDKGSSVGAGTVGAGVANMLTNR